MCNKRTKQLSDFQDFVDNLADNLDDIESREFSTADNEEHMERLSEQCDD